MAAWMPAANMSTAHFYVTIPSTDAPVTSVVTFTLDTAFTLNKAAASWVPLAEEEIPEELRRRALLRWTLAAIQVAQERLRSSQEDPAGVLSYRPRREPTRRLHDRPRVKGRVCSGASRYRVFRA